MLAALALGALLAVGTAPPTVAAPTAQETLEGTWTARVWENDAGDRRLQLRLETTSDRGGSSTMGFGVDLDEIRGPSAALEDTRDARFELAREAGTVALDGDFRDGRGSGFFTFTPSASYVSQMATLGYPDLSIGTLFTFAVQDVTTAYVRGLQDLGYRLDVDDLRRFAIHGIGLEYIGALADLGYREIPAEQLVRLRIHGVGADYVRRMREALAGG